MSRRLDRNNIARFLDEEDRKGKKTALTLRRDDARVAWDSLCQVPSEKNPSVDVGQKWAVRCKLGDGRALHILGRDSVIVMHVDKYDPAEQKVRHVVEETNAVPGALIGLGLGVLATLLGAPPKTALAIGTGLGAAVGGFVPVDMAVWEFDGVDGFGDFRFSRRDDVTPQLLLAPRPPT